MERNFCFDFMKGLAILAVVIIHTNPFNQVVIWGFHGTHIEFVMDTIARFAVPFFFLTAGFLFVQKLRQEEKQVYTKRYLFKLCGIYLVWQTIFILYEVGKLFFTSDVRASLKAYFSSIHILEMVYYGKWTEGYHLWFLPALVLCIFVTALFMKWNKLRVLFIAACILHVIGLIGKQLEFFPLPTRDALFFGLFYTTLGALLAQSSIPAWMNKKMDVRALILVLTGISIVQIAERYVLLQVYGRAGEFFASTVVLTLFMFMLAIQYPHFGRGSVLAKIGSKPIGIYVMHVLIISVCNYFLQFIHAEQVKQTIVWHVLFTPFVFYVSYFLYNVIQKSKRGLNLNPLTRSL